MAGLLLHPAFWVLRFALATQSRVALLGFWVIVLAIGLPCMDWLSRRTRLQTILVRKVKPSNPSFSPRMHTSTNNADGRSQDLYSWISTNPCAEFVFYSDTIRNDITGRKWERLRPLSASMMNLAAFICNDLILLCPVNKECQTLIAYYLVRRLGCLRNFTDTRTCFHSGVSHPCLAPVQPSTADGASVAGRESCARICLADYHRGNSREQGAVPWSMDPHLHDILHR